MHRCQLGMTELLSMTSYGSNLQQRDLSFGRRSFRKTNAETDEANWFARPPKCFRKERAEIGQGRGKAGALGSCAREIMKLQFYENFPDLAGGFLLREIGH